MSAIQSKINILYIDPTQGTGGATKSLLSTLTFIDRTRFNLFLMVHRRGPFTHLFEKAGVFIVSKKVDLMNAIMFDPNLLKNKGPDLLRKSFKLFGMCFKYFLKYITILSDYCKIIFVVKKHHIHLIHFNAYGDQYLPYAFIAFFLKIPVIYHVRGSVRPASSVRFFARFAFFIHVSQYVKQFFLSDGVITWGNHVIYNGRDINEFGNPSIQRNASAIRETLAILAGNKIIICIGTLTRGKGQYTFVKAANLVSRVRDDVTFLLVGDNVPYEDDIKSELTALIAEIHLENRVLLLGQRSDIAELLAMSDISVVSTELPEALCGVNIETMAANTPLIATDIGSVREVVVAEETGLLVPPGDYEAMAAAILRLLDDVQEAGEMAKRGRQRFLEKFNAEKLTLDLQHVYENLVPVA